MIADVHPVFRAGFVHIAADDPAIEMVADLDDGRSALSEIRRLEPDVAVIGWDLPGLDGIRVLRAVKRDRLPTRVILLATDPDSTLAYRAVAEGATGVVTQRAEPSELIGTVVAVGRGETRISDELMTTIAREIRARAGDAERPLLSDRQVEVLRLVAGGHSAREIARRLHLSRGTVRTHFAQLYGKLGVRSRAAAVAEGIRRGLID